MKARRTAANLYVAMSAANSERKRVHKLPTQKQVADGVTQARALPREVEC